ncbi:MAG: hypothetical protein ACD_19C00182G0012 [uncultured bacterium]|nr:MAG: hypothetical protein ACD_19C00182G0012 [uncultured bacterium]
MVKKSTYFCLLLIFLTAFAIRIYSFWPANIIIGFDQSRDFFDAGKILSGNLRIIGPTAGNNPNLHHGVAYLYYLATAVLFFGKSPVGMAILNSIFNALTVVIVYLLASSLFKNKKNGYIASILIATSFYYVSFSSWLSNPTVTLFTVPLFFFGIWEYYEGRNWGLPLTFLALGLSIQFELFFLYLILAGIIAWFILRPKLPTLKNILLSVGVLALTLSTMILTEIKFGFAGIKSMFTAGELVGGNTQKLDFLKSDAFRFDIFPDYKSIGLYLGIFAIIFLLYEVYKKRENLKRNLFLILWFLSPLLMLLLGIHNAPWFLIGRPASEIIITAYLLTKVKSKFLLIPLFVLVITLNLMAVREFKNGNKMLLEPDKSAFLSKQLLVIDYTYKSSKGEKFAINTVTNPLYINSVWAYNYDWYAKSKYGYLPSFAGGDQIPPYDTLPKSDGKEKVFYLIIDQTSRIPEIHKQKAIDWATKIGKLVEEKEFDGILVKKYYLK